ncbi:hypothetical protein HPB48_005274 [Haemaphysalis longicornis]|uniref:Uncharacterized protein n=1 Tax=Haemaphysalis longicornis TaxID=44386 RepID=A0A9J6H494_HAELO|nr:hypothetical protein HPB48_005274 [Haemaphysalis longicornis]
MRHDTNKSQKTPEYFSDEAKAFHSAMNASRTRHKYTLFNISKMDQMMVRMSSLASRTNNVVGKHAVQSANTGCAKRGFTVFIFIKNFIFIINVFLLNALHYFHVLGGGKGDQLFRATILNYVAVPNKGTTLSKIC